MECPYCEAEFSEPSLEKDCISGEFWGANFHETSLIATCPECGEELDDVDPRQILYERECDRADYLYDQMRDREMERQWEEETK